MQRKPVAEKYGIIQPFIMSAMYQCLHDHSLKHPGVRDVGTYALLRLLPDLDHVPFESVKRAVADSRFNFHFISVGDQQEVANRIITEFMKDNGFLTIKHVCKAVTGFDCDMRFAKNAVILVIRDPASAYAGDSVEVTLFSVSKVSQIDWNTLAFSNAAELKTMPFMSALSRLRIDVGGDRDSAKHVADVVMAVGADPENSVEYAVAGMQPTDPMKRLHNMMDASHHEDAWDSALRSMIVDTDVLKSDACYSKVLRRIIEIPLCKPSIFARSVDEPRHERNASAATIYDYTAHSTPLNIAILRKICDKNDTRIDALVPKVSGKFDIRYNHKQTYAVYNENVNVAIGKLAELAKAPDDYKRPDTVVYRCVTYADLSKKQHKAFHERALPFRIMNYTPCSTTTDIKVAHEFSKPNGVMMILRVPAKHDASVPVRAASAYPRENEVLIKAKTEFEINAVRFQTVAGNFQTVLIGDVVPAPVKGGGEEFGESVLPPVLMPDTVEEFGESDIVDLTLFDVKHDDADLGDSDLGDSDPSQSIMRKQDMIDFLKAVYDKNWGGEQDDSGSAAFQKVAMPSAADGMMPSAMYQLPDAAYSAKNAPMENTWKSSWNIGVPQAEGGGRRWRGVTTDAVLASITVLAAIIGSVVPGL